MVRTILITICLIVFPFQIGFAQQMKVVKCEIDRNDTFLEKNPRTHNDVMCAVLKIPKTIQGLKFEKQSDHKGDIVETTDNYYVYVVDGSYQYAISHANYRPLTINIYESFNLKARSGKTYLLSIEAENSNIEKRSDCTISFQLVSEIDGSPITYGFISLDNQRKTISGNNGVVEFSTKPGQYSIIAESYNYQPTKETIKLKPGTTAKTIRMSPKNQLTEISCNASGASVFVDDKPYGKVGKIALPYGSHRIRVAADDYLDQTQSVIINGETTSLSFSLSKNKGKRIDIHPINVKIISSSSRLFKNNKEIPNWTSGSIVKFMPGSKCKLSGDDGKGVLFVAGNYNMTIQLDNGIIKVLK